MSDEQLGDALDAAGSAGARWIRADISWADIQPTSPDEFVWDSCRSHRRTGAPARPAGTPILAYTPPWARSPGCRSDHCPPADPARFAASPGPPLTRYGPQSNPTPGRCGTEPNYAGPVARSRPVRLRPPARAVFPGAPRRRPRRDTNPGGGFAILKTERGNVSVADFLTRPTDSPLDHVDAVAIHPYTYPYPAGQLGPWASPGAPDDSGMPYLASTLAALGAPGMPLWITEYGAPTGGPGQSGTETRIPFTTDPTMSPRRSRRRSPPIPSRRLHPTPTLRPCLVYRPRLANAAAERHRSTLRTALGRRVTQAGLRGVPGRRRPPA